MFRTFRLLSLLGSLLLLTGCLFDNPPSGPSQSIDTWLVGQWETKDKSGHTCRTVVAPASSSHYRISLSGLKGGTQEFDAWIGRVDGFSILILKSLNEGSSVGKYALFHYELISPAKPEPGNIGATRIRLSELQLDESCRSLDSYKLRAAIRQGLKAGTLLAPYDVVAERKYAEVEQSIFTAEAAIASTKANNKEVSQSSLESLSALKAKSASLKHEVPGSVIWTKTGDVTLSGETF